MATKFHTPDPADAPELSAITDYNPVVPHRQRHDGWTAERQRTFLTALAGTTAGQRTLSTP